MSTQVTAVVENYAPFVLNVDTNTSFAQAYHDVLFDLERDYGNTVLGVVFKDPKAFKREM